MSFLNAFSMYVFFATNKTAYAADNKYEDLVQASLSLEADPL